MSYRATQATLDTWYKEWKEIVSMEPPSDQTIVDSREARDVGALWSCHAIMTDFQRFCNIEGLDAAVELTKRVYLNPPWVAI